MEHRATVQATAFAQALPESDDAVGVGGRDLARGLDLECDQHTVPFQNKVHLAARRVSPEAHAGHAHPSPRNLVQKPLALGTLSRYASRMADGQTTALERLLRPLSSNFTVELARALIGLQADAETQARYDELAEKRTEGQLTPAEAAELESIVRANTLLGLLKTEAHTFLAHARPS